MAMKISTAPLPTLPLPPRDYDITYMNLLLRDLNTRFDQAEQTGPVRGTLLNLDLKTLPTSATGLSSGDVWVDTATYILHIVP